MPFARPVGAPWFGAQLSGAPPVRVPWSGAERSGRSGRGKAGAPGQ